MELLTRIRYDGIQTRMVGKLVRQMWLCLSYLKKWHSNIILILTCVALEAVGTPILNSLETEYSLLTGRCFKT